MFTGHILALPAFYVILNFLVMVISTLLAELMNLLFLRLPRPGLGGGQTGRVVYPRLSAVPGL